ncbi:MAG TPA: chemotaxis protein CheW [Bacillaceae bacterium]|nr:chemotaxis protein CheW [Paenibacillus bovis]HLU21843.1 chemotaxis protein CheW [Bacillaceae bacterium]
MKDESKEMIEFRLARKSYGIDVLLVQEIIQSTTITPIPYAHPAITGIIQLRGEILPVIDFGRLWNNNDLHLNYTRFIVAKVKGHSVVFPVEEVNDIVRVSSEQIVEIEDVQDVKESFIIAEVLVGSKEAIKLVDFTKVLDTIQNHKNIA